ncbi:MAG TPA: SdpI family protein, partial [Verrucomicrobiae bacterium]|nr:SdpI family protein [Verrucomicrobiae bacterium]
MQVLVLLVPFCAVALLWDKLPERVPIHWDAQGEVNGYAGKAFGSLLVPLINIGVATLLLVITSLDPRLRQHSEEVKNSLLRTILIVRLVITGFLSVVSLAMLASATGAFKSGGQFGAVMHGAVALLFVVLGNYMTKLRPNHHVGIRTPWTLASEEVWRKTHRVGGPLMVISGLLMLALLPVVPLGKYPFLVMMPVVFG